MSYKKECQEKYFPTGSVPTLFSSRHSAQPFERALAIGEGSCSGDVVSCFVSSHETVRFLFLPVVPFPCRPIKRNVTRNISPRACIRHFFRLVIQSNPLYLLS